MRVTPKPLVSFIIPVLNGELYIERCLISIQNLEHPEASYEVLIMDNGSTDRTQRIVRDLGFHLQVVPEVRVGALRNRGATIARGEYVAFVDADVGLAPYWLRGALAVFNDRQVVASGCFPCVPQGATWVQQAWDIHQRGRHQIEPRPVPWLPSMNLIVRRDDFFAIAGFDEHLETAEDVDLCYRLGQRGKILCNPAMEAVHWGEARNLQTFWRKEVWRGIGNLHGIQSHGLRWDEIPSLGYPLYMVSCSVFFVLGAFADLWQRQIFLAPLGLILLVLPAWLLALNTVCQTRRPAFLLKLFLLYFTYGLARAVAVGKAWTRSADIASRRRQGRVECAIYALRDKGKSL